MSPITRSEVCLSKDSVVGDDGAADICQMVCRTTPLKKLYDNPRLEDVEFDVIPELSAQIYGIFESDRFDKKVKNAASSTNCETSTVPMV